MSSQQSRPPNTLQIERDMQDIRKNYEHIKEDVKENREDIQQIKEDVKDNKDDIHQIKDTLSDIRALLQKLQDDKEKLPKRQKVLDEPDSEKDIPNSEIPEKDDSNIKDYHELYKRVCERYNVHDEDDVDYLILKTLEIQNMPDCPNCEKDAKKRKLKVQYNRKSTDERNYRSLWNRCEDPDCKYVRYYFNQDRHFTRERYLQDYLNDKNNLKNVVEYKYHLRWAEYLKHQRKLPMVLPTDDVWLTQYCEKLRKLL